MEGLIVLGWLGVSLVGAGLLLMLAWCTRRQERAAFRQGERERWLCQRFGVQTDDLALTAWANNLVPGYRVADRWWAGDPWQEPVAQQTISLN